MGQQSACHNSNCVIVRRIHLQPFKRCPKCSLSARQCGGLSSLVQIFALSLSLVLITLNDSLPVRASLAGMCFILLLYFFARLNQAFNESAASTSHLLSAKQHLQSREMALAARIEQLESEKATAELSNESKSNFLATISHELRTPLTSILGFAQSLHHSPDAPLNADQQFSVSTIIDNGHHLQTLINELLDISKTEANKLTIHPTRTSIFDLLEELRASMSQKAQKKQLAFDIIYAYPLPTHFCIDPTRVRQILVNLCVNAIKFTDQGHVRVEIRCDLKNQLLHLIVEDTGIGIRAEEQDRLFEPYSQIDHSRAQIDGGTGLGLAISRKLAQLLGGDIRVQSELGQGCQFILTLPYQPCDDVHIVHHQDQQPTHKFQPHCVNIPNNLSGKVLIVEDTPDNQRLLEKLLSHTGLGIEITDNGKDALELVSRKNYDAIFMDIQMPNMDGIETTRILRDTGYQAPIFAISANAMQAEQQKAIDAGCNHYLVKPIDLVELYAVLGQSFCSEDARRSGDYATNTIKLVEQDLEFQALVNRFSESLDQQLSKLEIATNEQDWNTIRSIAHTLKGTAKSFGFPQLTNVAATILSQIDNHQHGQIRHSLIELRECCRPMQNSH